MLYPVEVAIRTMKVRVCDLCGNDVGITRYRISYLEIPRSITVDLCGPHGAPLEEIEQKIPKSNGPRPRPREVVSKEQVKAQRKPTAKKAVGNPRRRGS